jgi:cellulose synthase/poly-beta-1,6-N-acetylglucosamine synthase-like glycosyltransferase
MKLLFALVSFLLVVQLVYPFITVVLAQLSKSPNIPISQHPNIQARHFACIITAYRNAAIARPLVDSLLRQTYPNLHVYLVADECEEFDFAIADKRFSVLRPPLPLRLKVKSILHAFDCFTQRPDYVVVFDADNLAHPQFLEEINGFAHAGFQCIQGQRTAKNLDTSYAALDSMGEHYKNYIEREVPFRLGGSAVISGSGMATETEMYRAYLGSPEIEQGQLQWKKMLQEDKILQNFLLRRNLRIAYARQALVYDEKVETGEAVETQRSRWLFSYFQNLPNAVGIFRRGLLGLNFNQLYFGFVTLVLPMFIQLGLALATAVLALLVAPIWSLILFAAVVIFSLNILWVLRLDAAPPAVRKVVWQVPKFVLRQFGGLFKMRNPNKHFKHTEHRKLVSVDEVLQSKMNPDQES